MAFVRHWRQKDCSCLLQVGMCSPQRLADNMQKGGTTSIWCLLQSFLNEGEPQFVGALTLLAALAQQSEGCCQGGQKGPAAS